MSVIPDFQIRDENIFTPFIQPKYDNTTKDPISGGLSSYGYDIRLQDKCKLFTNVYGPIIDPLAFDKRALVDVEAEELPNGRKAFTMPPNSFGLFLSLEHFNVPKDAIGICVGKSTYARCGLIVNVTPVEPAWRGYLTIEISNTAPLPARIYAGMGIAQIVFFRGEPCQLNYGNKGGKYQDQDSITVAKGE